MAYKALYRTYRPTTFDEVAGQQHIVKTLKNALETKKIAHAYLFAGPRGTGKTTMAKIFAKALNCEEGLGHQCNNCKNCTAINDGSHPDVLELDAASNNGVDEIRELIDKVKYGTILGKYKVYIIDEVHMLTTGAFNALLKTLEEPPEHVIFILATTEPHKILPTILSRVQRYDFSKLSDEEIMGRLKIVLERENVECSDEVIKLVVSLADGGMRDALSIMDQVIAYSGNKVEIEKIYDIFSLESKEEKIALLNSIFAMDSMDVLNKMNNYIKRGTNITRLTEDLLTILKDILIYQTSRKTQYLEILNENEVRDLSVKIRQTEIIKMIDILMDTMKDYKVVPSVASLFEVTLLKLSSIGANPVENIKPVEPIKPTNNQNIGINTQSKSIVEEATPFEPLVKKSSLSKKTLYLKGTEGEDSFTINNETMINIMVSGKKEIKNELLENWKNIKRLTAASEYSKAASLLIDGRPLVSSNKILILEYPLQTMVEKVNAFSIQKELQDVIQASFDKKMFIYAVSRADSVRFQQMYMNKYQLKTLPKIDAIKLEFEGEDKL